MVLIMLEKEEQTTSKKSCTFEIATLSASKNNSSLWQPDFLIHLYPCANRNAPIGSKTEIFDLFCVF